MLSTLEGQGSPVRCLGIKGDGALAIAERVEV